MEGIEKEIEFKRTKSRSPSPGVKSTAVVKYTAYQSPVGYARLQCNTDLNTPPTDWGAAIDSYGQKQIVTDSDTGLSSFRMAHMFPDAVGDVDVISGAECIKKLLKLPYQPNGTVSMMVHRVENTILLDDFHVYDYLMKAEWSWLKDFFYENILKTMSEQERLKATISPAPSSALQLTHTFLSHSVAQTLPACPAPHPLPHIHTPMTIAGPFLPEPETCEKEEVPPTEEHLYNRNVLWTFEDIHMLIGSDLPIFGDKDRPCVSLRLRDAREPINVLTGIDYWLDNLMCNVPEVLMCYHIDGIVQEYEPMKTEDLPNMENSKFSPKIIRNVAQNILSFLKCNATKSGHTYWLFKNPHEDVVKLYDLTGLCPDSLDNPFTTPVAMLLYRVARNMRMTNRSATVKQLLEHVIKLLKVERYPQIVASSHYMLADVYVPATTDPAEPNFQDDTSQSTADSELSDFLPENEDICQESGVPESKTGDFVDNPDTQNDEDKPYKNLVVQIRKLTLKEIGDKVKNTTAGAKRHSAGGAAAGRSPPHRCGRALHHALHGLRALHNIALHNTKEEDRERLKQQIISEEQHPKMANPYEPIKMNYEPISKPSTSAKEHTSRKRKKRDRKTTEKSGDYLIESKSTTDKNAIQVIKEKKVHPNSHEPNRDDHFAWKLHLKTLLYEKICLVYATLAEYSYAKADYGFSLKYIEIASKCQKLLCNMIIKSKVVDASCLIGRIGDNHFQMNKNWSKLETYKLQYQTDHDIDSKIRLEIENDMVEEIENITVNDFDIDISFPTSQISAMLRSIEMYTRASELAGGKRTELLRRRASVLNELAVRYMNDAEREITTAEGPKRRTWLNACRTNYELAANMFAMLEDATMFLTVQLEHVAVLETQATVTPNLKLKSLQSAVQLLRKCHSIMVLLKDREEKDKEEQDKEEKDNEKKQTEKEKKDKKEEREEKEKEKGNEKEKEDPSGSKKDEKSKKKEQHLLSLYENTLHSILKSIIQYCRSKSNRDYEKITDTHKKLYFAALKIKKDDDVGRYAASICDALMAMDEVTKEFD